MEAARMRLETILLDAQAAGLSRSEAVRLAAARRPKHWRVKICRIVLLIMALAIVVKAKLYTIEGITTAWMWYYGRHPTADKCAVWMPDVAYHVFRPPVDCTVCRDVHQVERVYNITPEEFETKYAFSGRPVIVSDAMKNWTAPYIFSFGFFRELYAGSKAQDRCQFFAYKTNFSFLWEVFEMPKERAELHNGQEPWYVGWSNCDEEVGQIIRDHYSKPYFLPKNSENKNTDWIFMGSKGFGAHMHVDNVNNPSWQAQLAGAKNWTLLPPPECIYECLSHQVTINQGEIFVLDTNIWYHSTLIVSDGISITIGAEFCTTYFLLHELSSKLLVPAYLKLAGMMEGIFNFNR
ncbi:unnamed protein product [Nezara viridula]|uniref:Cupin-like domain-containing protein n=1 Tax=Nezara viridula TaxID=85310 RepID=A0A9P0MMI5_NEZVI|nr:unnamed protein product [Nezara viridula]